MWTELDELQALPYIDRSSAEWLEDSGSVIARLHQQSPLARSDEGVELLAHETARGILSSKDFAPAGAAVLLSTPHVPEHVELFVRCGLLPTIDGEKHMRIRKTMMGVFAARRVHEQRDLIRDTAQALLDQFLPAGKADFVADFTTAYPIWVVSEILGIPREDIGMFQEWALKIGHVADHPIGVSYPEVDEALAGMAGYVKELCDRRRKEPQDDFVTALVEQADVHGSLNEDELIYNLVNLVMAGQDTTRHQLASTLHLLGAHEAQWEALKADPSLAVGAVDEGMRLAGTVRRVYRTPRADVEVEGVLVPAGTPIVINIEAANRDPRVFSEPEKFDIRRPNASLNLTFSLGAHFCLGAALSKAEQAEALRLLAEQMPTFTVTDDVTFRSAAHAIGGPDRLVITFPVDLSEGVA